MSVVHPVIFDSEHGPPVRWAESPPVLLPDGPPAEPAAKKKPAKRRKTG